MSAHPPPAYAAVTAASASARSTASPSSGAERGQHDASAAAAAGPAPALTRRQQRQTQHQARPRDVNDVSDKQCWVCYATEDEDRQAGDSRREWVHACECTLVAHSDCLLAWYATDVANKQQQPCCPVCMTPYKVHERHSNALRTYKRWVRRWDKLSTAIAAAGIVGGCHLVLSAYGAFAIRAFAGPDVARALLSRHDDKLPLRYWLNLPLIPLTLVLSRTTLIDSLLPFGPLALVLSSNPAHTDTLGLANLSFSYPPSPTLTLCLLPWFRVAYLKLRHRVFDAVLGKRTRLEGLAGLMDTVRAADEGEFEAGVGPGRFEVVAEVEVEERVIDDGDDAQNQRADDGEGHQHLQPEVQGQQPNAVVNNRLRVGLSRLTSLVVGALLFPATCSIAGSALFFLASRQANRPRPSLPIALLRKLLGVQAIIAARAAGVAVGQATPSLTGTFTNYIKLILAPKAFPSRPVSPLVDPVWVRNAIGGAIVLLLRDAVELGAGVLELQRKASRSIVGRAFSDELDLGPGRTDDVDRQTRDSGASSGGVNDQGRRAIVHNLL
ncbi:hypothetical protein OIV83_003829 [Microbotryomycetes sp. JL201]|nr:hypothetical protein OIV83_003829 [Microbotryomycetes sp. JL201]